MRTSNVFGGDDPELRLRSSIASLWMKATGESFVKLPTDTEAQLDDIEEALKSKRPSWQQIKHAFDSGALSWSEVFEALMSDCGMTMNGALQCIAEHFDCRPAIEGTEAV